MDALLARGDTVTAVDNLSTVTRSYLDPRARLVQADLVSDPLEAAFADADAVFHTAALARVPRSIADPLGTHAANVTATLRVLIAARDAGVRRFVYSSSSSVYGDQDTLPLVEDMRANPLNPYAVQKYMGELYAQNFARVLRPAHRVAALLQCVWTTASRIGRVSPGDRDLPGSAAARPTAHDSRRRRTDPRLHDVWMWCAPTCWPPRARRFGPGEVLNVGAGRQVSVLEIARLIGGEIEHQPPRGFDERFKEASTAKARALLGWEPRVRFEDGLAELLRRSTSARLTQRHRAAETAQRRITVAADYNDSASGLTRLAASPTVRRSAGNPWRVRSRPGGPGDQPVAPTTPRPRLGGATRA